MKKIGIVLCEDGLPVPAVKGGAVEQLLTMLFEENEDNKKLYFNFYIPIKSKSEIKQLGLNKNYEASSFNYISTSRLKLFIVKVINKISRIVLKKNIITMPFYNKAYNKLVKDNNDFILFEGQYPLNIQKYHKKFGKQKLGFHIHCQFIADIYGADAVTQKFVIDKKTGIQNFGKVLCVSNFIKNDWVEIYNKLNYDSSNLYYYRNAVDESKFNKGVSKEEKFEIREKLGFNVEDFVCVFCGRISEIKGVKELMQAVINLNNPKVKLLIIGSVNFDTATRSEYLEEVEKLCKEHSDKIKFTGYIKNTEIYKYLKSSDVEVIPSLWNDAAPLTALEARWAGVPIIVTRSGGLPEHTAKTSIIINRDDKVVSNLEKAISNWANNKEQYNLAKTGAMENIQKFGKSAYYENFIKLMNGETIDE